MLTVQNFKDLFTSLGVLLAPAWAAIRKHAVWTAIIAFGSLAVAALVTNAWSAYDRWRTREIVFLTGPVGGSGADPAQRIAEHAAYRSAKLLGGRYHLRVQTTNGFEENRRRVGQDRDGLSVAFAHDGFGDASNVAILLPLEWNYLQLLCTKKFREGIPGKEGGESKLTLSDLQDKMTPGRVYLGPNESGTRQLAELVLSSYGHNPHRLASTGIADWHDMRAALYVGNIDVAFYSGPPNAPIIKAIADDEKCLLIGLDGTRNAIAQQNYQLLSATLQPNLYATNGFCPHAIETIASRRVLICSRAMSESDAYFLANVASEALQDSMEIKWQNMVPDPTNKEAKPLAYTVHPGAARLRDKQSAPGWLTSWPTILIAMGIFVLGEIARFMAAKSSTTKDQSESDTPLEGVSLPRTYPELFEEINRRIASVIASARSWDAAQFKKWSDFAVRLEAHIEALQMRGDLTSKEAQVLFKGARELRYEIEIHEPELVKRARHKVDSPLSGNGASDSNGKRKKAKK